MDKIVIIKNDALREKFDYLKAKYCTNMPEEYVMFINMQIINFKRISNNEDFLILILLYGLIFFKRIDLDNEHISKIDRIRIQHLKDLHKYEITNSKEEFLDKMYETEEELFNLKMLIKYSVILFENKSNNIIISDRTNFYKAIGYVLPYLTLKESNMLGFFQDAYFKQLYPEQFIKTKMIYLDKVKKSGTAGGYIISIVNNLTEALEEGGIMARIYVRKKSYFSIFNKIKRKHNADFLDSIGVRIIFKDLDDLKIYEEIFEEKFIYSKKKDFITNPKTNGYQSLHYSFMTTYDNNEIYIELQLRTIEMEKKIHDAKEISHYSYTIKKNKWDELFSEVQYGHKHLLKFIEKNKK